MKTFFFILFSAGLLLELQAAELKHIEGYVYEKSTRQPIVGAVVNAGKSGGKAVSNARGYFKVPVTTSDKTLVIRYLGFQTKEIPVPASRKSLKIYLEPDNLMLKEEVVIGYGSLAKIAGRHTAKTMYSGNYYFTPPMNYTSESYQAIAESGFKRPVTDPLSTFSIDVDAASYSNMRRFINQGQLPPKDALRIEEMINYFKYDYAEPTGHHPINIATEVSQSPWNKKHHLLKVGLKAKTIDHQKLSAANLVFLIDVSGSMQGQNRLELLKTSFKLLTDQLRPQDKVAIVVYAGAAGVVLPSTHGNQKTKIKEALSRLEAGGSTAGGAGIKLAYELASKSFVKGGNNRVILATDGDFNVGASSDSEMQRLIEEKRKSGVFLTVLGFGMGNLKDSKMETLANKGNGNYAYIDNLTEAKKVLVNEFGATLFTVAKDVKLQLEFNPAKVQAYRLIGYENRLLNNEDFIDDRKDAGEMGAGHTVTALYEIIPVGISNEFLKNADALKYQQPAPLKNSSELLTIKLRYKKPAEDISRETAVVVADKIALLENASPDLKFAAALATFGMLLRDSEFKQDAQFKDMIKLARSAKGKDEEGFRTEFITLAENAKLLYESQDSNKEELNISNENK